MKVSNGTEVLTQFLPLLCRKDDVLSRRHFHILFITLLVALGPALAHAKSQADPSAPCSNAFARLASKFRSIFAREIPKTLRTIDPENLPPGKLLVDPKLIFPLVRLQQRHMKDLGAEMVNLPDGSVRYLLPDANELNRLWGLDVPDTPLRFVQMKIGNDPNIYHRQLANRIVVLDDQNPTTFAHDYMVHALGYKLLAERGQFTQYADAMKYCFSVVDNSTIGAEHRSAAAHLINEIAEVLESATTNLTLAGQGNSALHLSQVDSDMREAKQFLAAVTALKARLDQR